MLGDPSGREPRPGLLDSLRNLAATTVAIAHNRLELLSVDLEEELVRLGQLLLLAGTALFCIALGIVLAAILVVVLFWDTHRIAVLALLALVFLGAGVVTGSVFLGQARAKPRPFASSLAELSRDHGKLRDE